MNRGGAQGGPAPNSRHSEARTLGREPRSVGRRLSARTVFAQTGHSVGPTSLRWARSGHLEDWEWPRYEQCAVEAALSQVAPRIQQIKPTRTKSAGGNLS